MISIYDNTRECEFVFGCVSISFALESPTTANKSRLKNWVEISICTWNLFFKILFWFKIYKYILLPILMFTESFKKKMYLFSVVEEKYLYHHSISWYNFLSKQVCRELVTLMFNLKSYFFAQTILFFCIFFVFKLSILKI